jgi:hypothetical protein
MLSALAERLCHPGIPASSSSTFATLLPGEPFDLLLVGEPFDLLLVGSFDRSLLGQGPVGLGIVGRSGVILVARGIGTSNRATAPRGGNCFLPDADI